MAQVAEKDVGTVNVATGNIITGRYKRKQRTGKVISLAVDRCLKVADSFGTVHPYVAGTRMDDAQIGNVMALRADCFVPTTVVITEDPEYEALGDGYYVNPDASDPMYGFFEQLLDDADIVEAKRRKILPAEEYEVDSLDVLFIATEDEVVEAETEVEVEA
jgi:hypothetical protein